MLLGLLWGVPALLSTDLARREVVSRLNEQLDGEASVGDFSVSLLSGLSLRDLVVLQPEGHGEGEALRVDAVDADVSLWSLLWGRLEATVTIEAPRLVVHRNAAGRINWQDLLGIEPATGGGSSPDRSPSGGDAPSPGPSKPGTEPDWSAFRFQVALTGGSVEIQEEGKGTVHALRDLEFTTGTGPDGPPWTLRLTARMEDPDPATEDGRFTLDGSLDPRGAGTATLELRTDRLDLAVYQPLLAGFGVDLEEFQGVLEGNLTARMEGEEVFQVGGDLRATDVAVAGAALGGHSVHVPQLVVQPTLEGDAAQGAVTNDAFLVDLTFLQLRGLPAADTKALFAEQTGSLPLGFRVELDLPALKQHTSFIPAVVERLAGQMDLQVGARSTEKGNLAAWSSAPLEFVVRGGGRDLDVGGSFAPGQLRIPSDLSLTLAGRYDAGTGVLEVPDTVVQLGQTALHAGLTFDPAAKVTSTLRLEVDGDLARDLVQAFAPAGLGAEGTLGLDATMACAWPPRTDDLAALLQGLDLSGSLAAPDLTFRENRLAGAGLTFQVQQGAAGMTLADGAALNGGGLTLAGTFQPDATGGGPVSLDLGWDGGRAGASLAPLLQYAVPVLAGWTDSDLVRAMAGAEEGGSSADFESAINLGLKVAGPLRKDPGESWVQYLGRWAGKGSVGLQDGAFTPGEGMTQLATLLGQEGKVTFKRLNSSFQFDRGMVEIPKVALRTGGAPLLLSGRTGLDGSLAFELDVSEFLKERLADERLTALLGNGAIPAARLGGTLWKPELDLGDALKDGLSGLAETLKQGLTDRIKEDPGGALKDALNLLNRKKDRDKKDQGDGGGPESCP